MHWYGSPIENGEVAWESANAAVHGRVGVVRPNRAQPACGVGASAGAWRIFVMECGIQCHVVQTLACHGVQTSIYHGERDEILAAERADTAGT